MFYAFEGGLCVGVLLTTYAITWLTDSSHMILSISHVIRIGGCRPRVKLEEYILVHLPILFSTIYKQIHSGFRLRAAAHQTGSDQGATQWSCRDRKYWMGPVVMKQKWPFSANRFEAVRRRDVSLRSPPTLHLLLFTMKWRIFVRRR